METQLRRDVEALVRHGERVVGGTGHRVAREHLLARMGELHLENYHGAYEHPYGNPGQGMVNLVARIPGRSEGLDPILLGAHYDTCGHQPGADDNAAAVAILLACIEPLREAGLERDVIVAFFDAEEPPYFQSPLMGSVHYYAHQRRETIHAALILDLCGHDVPVPGHEDLLFITGAESAGGLAAIVSDVAARTGPRIVAVRNDYVGDMSDQHAFRRDGRPYLFLTCGRWEHYHQPTDTPDRLSFGKMTAIAATTCQLALSMGRTTLEPGEVDTLDLETMLLRENMGSLVTAAGDEMTTRDDVDHFVSLVTGRFGM